MEPIRECPHCGEPTVPNRLGDGQVTCSCAAERELPGPRPVGDAARPEDGPASGGVSGGRLPRPQG
ncbi:hypothetical protein [Roseomonas indoligenes]|uniref:Uncharacterized protein n=1 Tax=Roseomonas indoligenes TaxID=2820811 RepID=A0A940MYI5_9PROT|nr:hypothetical protein [Pararoseomonas indoligenes]MBP0493194.1 hypothetical protein [Pararoseomonas indoligenes]